MADIGKIEFNANPTSATRSGWPQPKTKEELEEERNTPVWERTNKMAELLIPQNWEKVMKKKEVEDESGRTKPLFEPTYLSEGGHPRFNELLIEISKLHATKDHDYAPTYPFENFMQCEKFGIPAWKGAMIRLSDKYSRIVSLVQKEAKVTDESMRDTLLDLAAYSIIVLILREEEMKESELGTQTEEKAC